MIMNERGIKCLEKLDATIGEWYRHNDMAEAKGRKNPYNVWNLTDLYFNLKYQGFDYLAKNEKKEISACKKCGLIVTKPYKDSGLFKIALPEWEA